MFVPTVHHDMSPQANSLMQHVILIGGFAASISLQKYLHRRLSDFCKRHSLDPIELTLPENNT